MEKIGSNKIKDLPCCFSIRLSLEFLTNSNTIIDTTATESQSRWLSHSVALRIDYSCCIRSEILSTAVYIFETSEKLIGVRQLQKESLRDDGQIVNGWRFNTAKGSMLNLNLTVVCCNRRGVGLYLQRLSDGLCALESSIDSKCFIKVDLSFASPFCNSMMAPFL